MLAPLAPVDTLLCLPPPLRRPTVVGAIRCGESQRRTRILVSRRSYLSTKQKLTSKKIKHTRMVCSHPSPAQVPSREAEDRIASGTSEPAGCPRAQAGELNERTSRIAQDPPEAMHTIANGSDQCVNKKWSRSCSHPRCQATAAAAAATTTTSPQQCAPVVKSIRYSKIRGQEGLACHKGLRFPAPLVSANKHLHTLRQRWLRDGVQPLVLQCCKNVTPSNEKNNTRPFHKSTIDCAGGSGRMNDRSCLPRCPAATVLVSSSRYRVWQLLIKHQIKNTCHSHREYTSR